MREKNLLGPLSGFFMEIKKVYQKSFESEEGPNLLSVFPA